MKKCVRLFSALLVMVFSIFPIYAIEIPPSTDAYYLDEANVLSQSTEEYITDKNYEMDLHCGAYIEVVTERFINCDVADYTYKIQNEWEISDNGFTLVMVTEEEKYYLMWGREIEKRLEPYIFQDIMEKYFEPDFDAGNYDAAVRKTYDAIYDELVKIYGSPVQENSENGFSFVKKVLGISSIFTIISLIIVLVIVLSILSSLKGRRRNYYNDDYYGGRSYRTPTHRVYSSHRTYSSSRPSGRSFSSRSSSSSSHRSSGGSSSRSSGGRSHGGGGRGAGVGRR